MNSKQRRTKKRMHLFYVGILEELAVIIETGQDTPENVAKEIRELKKMLEREQP